MPRTLRTLSIIDADLAHSQKIKTLREPRHIPCVGLLTEFQSLKAEGVSARGVTEGDANDERYFLGFLGGLNPDHRVRRSLSVSRRNAEYGHLATTSTLFVSTEFPYSLPREQTRAAFLAVLFFAYGVAKAFIDEAIAV